MAVWEQARLCQKSVVGSDRLRGGDLRALRWQLSALSYLTTDGQREVTLPSALGNWKRNIGLYSTLWKIFRAGWMDNGANQARGAVLCGARFLDFW